MISEIISPIIFTLFLAVGAWFFAGKVKFIRRNILLGRDLDLSDNPAARWKQMLWVAMGQSKMAKRPVAAIFHLFVYLGFVLINIEVLEILVDGITGHHRAFSGLGSIYNVAIGFFEILAFLVIVACVVFLARRYIVKVPRLNSSDLKGWPKKDATIILVVEIVLMAALLMMNSADQILQQRALKQHQMAAVTASGSVISATDESQYGDKKIECLGDEAELQTGGEAGVVGSFESTESHIASLAHYLPKHHDCCGELMGSFPVSKYLVPMLDGFEDGFLIFTERAAWWFHFIGILLFLNYVPYSKHWHIIMSFPNVYYTPLKPKGEFDNMSSVTTEVNLMMDPSAVPPDGYEPPAGFGARDVQDLSWKNLMDAYTCTECGRCSSVCPANITGKLLSPRKIMMSTRDRLEEVGNGLDAGIKSGTIHKLENGNLPRLEDGKDLHSYISSEELWACTTCNACAEACPVNINPVDIIVQMRQYLVMEKSAAPGELNSMFTNLENNGAPWQFNQMDKANWAIDTDNG